MNPPARVACWAYRSAIWYQSDTNTDMPMTLRLSDAEHQRLERRAEADGISMQEAATIAICEYLDEGSHRGRAVDAASAVMEAHRDALDRLGH